MKAQQRKVRNDLQKDLSACQKGINEYTKGIDDANSQINYFGDARATLKVKAQRIQDKLDDDHIELFLSDHAIMQYLKRIRPDLMTELKKEIFADKTILRKKIGDTITTVYLKG